MNDFYCENVLNNKLQVEKIKETDNVLVFFTQNQFILFTSSLFPKSIS